MRFEKRIEQRAADIGFEWQVTEAEANSGYLLDFGDGGVVAHVCEPELLGLIEDAESNHAQLQQADRRPWWKLW